VSDEKKKNIDKMLGVEKSLIMDINLEKNDGTISSLFQQIIFDMKVSDFDQIILNNFISHKRKA
jgi:hypothetical protein